MESFLLKLVPQKNYNEATTSLNASVVSLAPPSAESESSDIFFPTIFLFATLLNRLWYCILSWSHRVIFARTERIFPVLSVLMVKSVVTWCFPWSTPYEMVFVNVWLATFDEISDTTELVEVEDVFVGVTTTVSEELFVQAERNISANTAISESEKIFLFM